MSQHTFESIQKMITDGASESEIDAALVDENTALTSRQCILLQRELNLREARRVVRELKEQAARRAKTIVDFHAQAGGSAEIRRLATYGWPANRELADDSLELRYAIQDEAKRLEAELAPDTERNTDDVCTCDVPVRSKVPTELLCCACHKPLR
jgi:hypothetical protein